jgi:transposase
VSDGKDVDRFKDDDKRQAVDLVAARLGRWPRNLRDSVPRRWLELRGAGREPTAPGWRPTTSTKLPSADHAAGIARLQRENELLHMERDIFKKTVQRLARLCGGRNDLVLASAAGRVAAVRLLEAQSPLKNMVHGCVRT